MTMKSNSANRREFGKKLAALAAVPLAGSNAAGDDTPKPPDPRTATVQALLEIIKVRYGEHLTEEQMKSVQRNLQRGLGSAERLKQFPLKNSDEPDFLFRAEFP
jgi:hypothetical protein